MERFGRGGRGTGYGRAGRGGSRGRLGGAARRLGLCGGVVVAAVLAAGLALASASRPAAAATPGRDRFAADLESLTKQQLVPNKEIPERDKPRTAQCLAKAIAADIPEADAAKLSDMFNRRAAIDKALELKWLTIGKKEAPARYQQVINAVQKLCPDLEPYVEPMF
jgi:hypothetical protein